MDFSFIEHILLWVFILLSGYSGALFAVKGTRDSIAFAFFYALLAALSMSGDSLSVFEKLSTKDVVFSTALILSGVAGCFFFSDLNPEKQFSKLLYSVAGVAFSGLSLAAIASGSSFTGLSIIGAFALCGLLSFINIEKSERHSLFLGLACLSAAAAGGMIFIGQPALFWAFMAMNGGLYIAASLFKVQKLRENTIERVEKDHRMAQSLARLKQSKETADQARLLRVIERERELMGELREREVLRTQEMRLAKDIADEANRAKSAFLAVVSHEIRTPMNGIMGMLRLLQETQTDPQQSEYLDAMKNSGDTMLALLNDILDFEKIESGNLELEVIDFDMVKVVQDVSTLMKPQAQEKEITLKINTSEDFPHMLKGDPTRLRQVLLNLVSNAIKFTSEGSITLYLKASQDEQGVFNVYCAVEDTGIGISEEAQQNLFKPFTQAETSTSRKYGGTGLGLAICRRLVEAMGGEIQVNSEEGQGSTFFFNMRMQEGDQAFTENADDVGSYNASIPALDPMNILIIEDNEMNQRVLRGFLEKDNHALTILDDAEQALEILKSKTFDVLITDILLSGMDGITFAKNVRSNEISTPIIALTGNIKDEDKEAYRNAGMNGFLGKPVTPENLHDTLSKIARNTLDWPLANQTYTEPEQTFQASFQDDEDFDSFDDAEDIHVEQDESTDSIFDSSFLQSLAESLPQNQFEELLGDFLRKADEIINALSDTDDKQILYERAHELKGMASNFGFKGVGDLSAAIEKASKDGQIQKALEDVKKLPDIHQEAQNQLNQWIENL